MIFVFGPFAVILALVWVIHVVCTTTRCPHCLEDIKKGARVCKHCKRDVVLSCEPVAVTRREPSFTYETRAF